MAQNCPENFQNRSELVGAEIARIEGRPLEAEPLYEQAICSAHSSGFVHNEGIANEAAGRFYLSRGLETNAYAHFRNASVCFAAWGADAKVMQLESRYPRLVSPDMRQAMTMPGASFKQFDFETIVKASQAVSSEIVLPRLVEQLMTITLQSAGADRGLLVLPRADEYRVEAEALMSGDEVVLRHRPAMNPAMPRPFVRYVLRTREKVILEDAAKPNPFSEDEYLSGGPPRSLLCLPSCGRARWAGYSILKTR